MASMADVNRVRELKLLNYHIVKLFKTTMSPVCLAHLQMTMIMMAMRTIRIRTMAPAIPPRTGPTMGWVGAADVDGDVEVIGVVVGGVVVGGVVAIGVVVGGTVVGGTVVGGTVVGGAVVGGAVVGGVVVGGVVVGGVVVGVTLGLGVGVVLTSDVEKGF